jgi:hypothetical protein
VRQDIDGGHAVVDGAPPVSPVGEPQRFGGIWDRTTRRIIGPSESPIIWFAGEEQSRIICGQTDPGATRVLHYSAEGGGKTHTMAQWLVAQSLRCAELGDVGYAGATAPTSRRLTTLFAAIRECIPIDTVTEPRDGAWGTYYVDAAELRFIWGLTIQFRATKRQSGATGSPIQGYTWRFSGDDEIQDSAENGADPDIEARLRGARTSRRYCTATAKDSTDWRNFRDQKRKSSDWQFFRTAYNANPFVWPEHWHRMQRNMSEREWQRRGLAQDVGPERAVYPAYERDLVIRTIPDVGATDVTRSVLAKYGTNFGALVGYDPGTLFDVSLILKAYRFNGEPYHRWFVVDELTTERTQTSEHARALISLLQEKHGMCARKRGSVEFDDIRPVPLIRCDPYGDTDSKTDRSVYVQVKRLGLDIRSAAFKKGKGNGRVPKEAGIEMVNRLLKSAAGVTRLHIACDSKGVVCAPRLTKSLELSERDGNDKAEAQRKDKNDLSHWGAALRYALWILERPKVADYNFARVGA